LAERKEDIPLLVEHFLKLVGQEYGQPPSRVTPKAMEALQKLPWTGNVRELRNVIERLVIMSGQVIGDAEVKRYAQV
jgi:DNA-binding NtrC family response regulator